MKHRFQCLREQLQKIYMEFDSFSMFRVVFDEIDRLNAAYHNNFYDFNRHPAAKRVTLTESKLCDEFQMRYEFSLLQRKGVKIELEDDGLPLTRALVGPERTNVGFSEKADKSYSIFKTNNCDGRHTALHMTLEHTEKSTSIRFARTMFLTTLVRDENYMKGVYFTDDKDEWTASEQGLANQKNALTLFNVYQALIKAFETVSHDYLLGQTTTKQLLE